MTRTEEHIRTARRIRAALCAGISLVAFGAGCLFAHLKGLDLTPETLLGIAAAALVGLGVCEAFARLVDHMARKRL